MCSMRVRRCVVPGVLMILVILTASTAMAQSGLTSAGNLLIARDVVINDTPVSAGITILNHSRIRTGPSGMALVNLGNLGRVKIGPDSIMVLDFADGKVGGELLGGWVIVTTAKGIGVSVKTADGIATSDSSQAVVMTIDVRSGNTLVESSQTARITAGNKNEFIAAGEEVAVNRTSPTAEPTFSHSRPAGISGSLTPPPGNFGSLLAASFSNTIRTIRLDRTVNPSPSRNMLSRGIDSRDQMSITNQSQQVTCDEPDGICDECKILPDLVKGKARCVTQFIVSIKNVTTTSHVSVRPFFSSACFRIFPGYPQQVSIPPGGAAPFDFNALRCPTNAGQLPQNSTIIIQSDTCGFRTVQVEWAPPCR